jgi:hypothetical protein
LLTSKNCGALWASWVLARLEVSCVFGSSMTVMEVGLRLQFPYTEQGAFGLGALYFDAVLGKRNLACVLTLYGALGWKGQVMARNGRTIGAGGVEEEDGSRLPLCKIGQHFFPPQARGANYVIILKHCL